MRSGLVAALLAPLLGMGCANTSHPRFDGDDAGAYRYGYEGADQKAYDEWTVQDELPEFEHYVKWQRGRLEKNWEELYADGFPTRPGREPVDRARYLEAHTPVDRSPPADCKSEPRAVLLVHGLYDSPYVMRDLEALFRDLCFHTRTLLLPGHGTRPGHLRTTGAEDWERAVRFAVLSFRKDVGKPYIAGFSTGGALALREAIVHPDQISGIFLFAPAIRIPGGRYLWLAALLGDPDWVPTQVFDDDDYVKYESIAMRSVYEIDGLSRKVDELLEEREGRVAVPTFTALSLNDFTTDSPNTIRHFLEGRLGDPSRLVVFGERCRPSAAERCEEWLLRLRCLEPPAGHTLRLHSSTVLDEGVLDFSHMSLTLRGDDPHYGISAGSGYFYCHHYPEAHRALRERCENPAETEVAWGERGGPIDPDRVLRRLTSNPRFDVLEEEIRAFVGEIQSAR